MTDGPPTNAGRNAVIASVVLCVLSLGMGLFAAPILTFISAPVSYFTANWLTRFAWLERHPGVATIAGVVAGAFVSVAVLIYAVGLLL